MDERTIEEILKDLQIDLAKDSIKFLIKAIRIGTIGSVFSASFATYFGWMLFQPAPKVWYFWMVVLHIIFVLFNARLVTKAQADLKEVRETLEELCA